MAKTYVNPVYTGSFPDPFVLKFCGEYWAYCTGIWKDGRCIGILRSKDLVNWQEVGGAMEPLPENPPYYWAPEVSYYNGRFYLYYSVGNETLMEIRVAVAEHPGGPFVDSGKRLTREPFAIDAHVFEDEDGSRYLFYATDYLEHSHIGTGTAVAKMLDPFTLAGNPRPVTRARYDWQVYDPHRIEKGGVRWHTIEGPFVLKHKNHYYQMFSGGNWHNISYGVSYAISKSLDHPEEWRQVADGVEVLPILRTIPGKVIGPGHNSVVRGPDNRQLYCVYHRWSADGSARQMAIDPLDWAGERMLVLGPSTEREFLPLRPTFESFGSGSPWQYSDTGWSIKENEIVQESQTGKAEASFKLEVPYFLTQVNLRTPANSGIFGIALQAKNNKMLQLELEPGQRQISLCNGQGQQLQKWPLPEDFNFQAYHLISLEAADSSLAIKLDEGKQYYFRLTSPLVGLTLFTQNCSAAFAGFQLTTGWEDQFLEDYPLSDCNWEVSEGTAENWQVHEQELWGQTDQAVQLITKGPTFENYELVVNALLIEQTDPQGGYGFYPNWYSANEPGLLFKLEQKKAGWVLHCEGAEQPLDFWLPAGFKPQIYQQFRFRKEGDRLFIRWEETELGETQVQARPSRIGLQLHQAKVAFDLVRLTKQ
jgi:GH43 family beta-xylosidase